MAETWHAYQKKVQSHSFPTTPSTYFCTESILLKQGIKCLASNDLTNFYFTHFILTVISQCIMGITGLPDSTAIVHFSVKTCFIQFWNYWKFLHNIHYNPDITSFIKWKRPLFPSGTDYIFINIDKPLNIPPSWFLYCQIPDNLF